MKEDHVKAADGCHWLFRPFAKAHVGTFYRTLACGTRVQFGEWRRYWDGSGWFDTLGEAPTVALAKAKLEALRVSQERGAAKLRQTKRPMLGRGGRR